ncbi:MAG: hypothetical protein JW841_15685 [Deltaproteobacteria bacterium]|nr:hypothetical protein [Deltaproteobacteria bacterium]
MQRRRYDTAALVGDIKKERRNAVILLFVGVAILVFLVVYFTHLRGADVPEVPKENNRPANSAQDTLSSSPKVVSNPTPKSSTTEPATPTPDNHSENTVNNQEVKPSEDAVVIINLIRPGPILIDGKMVVKRTKKHEVKLAPGKHRIATKIGRKIVKMPINIEANRRYRVNLTARKKRNSINEIEQSTQ